jgi:hypothetical protein
MAWRPAIGCSMFTGWDQSMAAIENTILIERGQQDVFDYLVDLRNELHRTRRGVDAELTDGPIGVAASASSS